MLSKKNIGLMYALVFLQGMVFYSAVATLYRTQAGISLTEMALIESVSFVLALLLEVPWGLLADRIGYRKTMIVCSVLFALSKVVFWQAETFVLFLLERVLLAVVCAGMSGVDASILVASCPEDRQQRVFGLYNALGNAGLLVASVGFTLFFTQDYRAAARWTAVAYALAALLPFFLTEVKAEAREARPALASLGEALRALLKTPALLLLILAGSLFGEVSHYAATFLSQLQYLRCGMGSAAMGAVFTGVTVMSLLSPLSEPLTDRLGKRRTGVLLMTTAAVCCIVLAATRSPAASVAAFLLIEAAVALYNPLHSVIENGFVHTQDRATALSVNDQNRNGVVHPNQLTLSICSILHGFNPFVNAISYSAHLMHKMRQEFRSGSVLPVEREYRGTLGGAGPLHHRE